MGRDKAALRVEGEPLAHRVARELARACGRVTVLGREPLPGYGFLLDVEEYAGPKSALAAFQPEADLVFVAACDMPLFRAEVVAGLRSLIGYRLAVVPMVDGKLQPLCALYALAAWKELPAVQSASMMAWLDRLDVRVVTELELESVGIDPRWIKGCNSQAELAQLLADD